MDFRIKEKSNIVYHFLFLGIVWLFFILFFSYNSENLNYVLVFSSILIPITAIPTYIMVYVLIPKYLSRKKYLKFGIYSLSTLFFTTFCTLALLMMSVAYVNDFKFEDLPPLGRNFIYLTILVYLIVVLASFASVWIENAQTKLKNNELQKQLLTVQLKSKEQELAYLKNQIHPHFLFNTLNTIYGLSLKKSIETPDTILKLSNLLDYVLYQTDKPEVSLKDEITHIEEYIGLEKIRFYDTLKINFTKEIENQNRQIAPMLLLPFVENAFKHGSVIDGFLIVNIHLKERENEYYFNIKNTYKQRDTIDGLGLKNIKERLEILYPGNYNLKIDTKPNWFEVTLKLNHSK